MRRGRFVPDSRGVAGFFEELPLLTIVVVALTLFLASLFTAHGIYFRTLEDLRYRQTAQDFAENIYAHRLLTGGGPGGRFLAPSLSDDVRVKIEGEFRPEGVGFHYNLTIADVSDYPDALSWTAGEPAAAEVRLVTKPVLLVDGDLAHAGLLFVRVWR